MTCGKGTYVRAIARDLAFVLGTYGYITALHRTFVGGFTMDSAISFDKLSELSDKDDAQEALLGIGAALDDILALPLSKRRPYG